MNVRRRYMMERISPLVAHARCIYIFLKKYQNADKLIFEEMSECVNY